MGVFLLVAKNRANDATVFCAFSAGSKWPSPPDRRLPCAALAVLRQCSFKGLIRGAAPKAPAQKAPSAPWPTLAAADCCRLAATLVNRQRILYSSEDAGASAAGRRAYCSLLCQRQFYLPQDSNSVN